MTGLKRGRLKKLKSATPNLGGNADQSRRTEVHKTLKTYELDNKRIILADDGMWYYVISQPTQFWSKYSDYDDAEEVWFDQIRVAEYNQLNSDD